MRLFELAVGWDCAGMDAVLSCGCMYSMVDSTWRQTKPNTIVVDNVATLPAHSARARLHVDSHIRLLGGSQEREMRGQHVKFGMPACHTCLLTSSH